MLSTGGSCSGQSHQLNEGARCHAEAEMSSIWGLKWGPGGNREPAKTAARYNGGVARMDG